jgi:purine nucleoside permease
LIPKREFVSRFVARLWTLLAAAGACAASLIAQTAAPPAKPIVVKVVVLSMFEVGEDTGDTPGEY